MEHQKYEGTPVLMYGCVHPHKPVIGQTTTNTNRHQQWTSSPWQIHNKNEIVHDALAELAKQEKANEKPAQTENPANIAHTGHLKENTNTTTKEGTTCVATTNKAKTDKADDKAPANKIPLDEAQI